MVVFYWVMGLLIVGTFTPAVLYLLCYVISGEEACLRRARSLWNLSRAAGMFGINVLIWGHVIVGLWQIWFR